MGCVTDPGANAAPNVEIRDLELAVPLIRGDPVHIVTKVLVVFAAVLAVLLAALTMAYSVNADRILDDYHEQIAARRAAETLNNATQAQSQEVSARHNLQLEQLRNDLNEAESLVLSLQRENEQLISEKQDANLKADSVLNQIGQLGQTNKTQMDLLTAYSNELTQLREKELQFRRREIQLVDRINDLESQNEVLDQTVRAVQEQLAELRLAAASDSPGVTTASDGERIVELPGDVVQARIVETRVDERTGRTLAQIDAGINDRIRENVRLFVTRGNEYVCDLVVVKADLQWAIGEVESKGRDVEIRPSDTVLSRLQ